MVCFGGVSLVSVLFYIVFVFVVLFGWVFLCEWLGVWELLVVGGIFVGIGFISFGGG